MKVFISPDVSSYFFVNPTVPGPQPSSLLYNQFPVYESQYYSRPLVYVS